MEAQRKMALGLINTPCKKTKRKRKGFRVLKRGSEKAIQAPGGKILPIIDGKAYYPLSEKKELNSIFRKYHKDLRVLFEFTKVPSPSPNAPFSTQIQIFGGQINEVTSFGPFQILCICNELEELMILKARENFKS